MSRANDEARRTGEGSERSSAVDRRTFLGVAGAAAGLAAAAAVAPLSARAAGLRRGYAAESSSGTTGSRTTEAQALDESWDIDDMWGHAPRYAHPIPYSQERTSPIEWEQVDPIDRMLMI